MRLGGCGGPGRSGSGPGARAVASASDTVCSAQGSRTGAARTALRSQQEICRLQPGTSASPTAGLSQDQCSPVSHSPARRLLAPYKKCVVGGRFTPIETCPRNYDSTKLSLVPLALALITKPATCTMRSGRPSFIALPVKSDKALEDIRNLLAGTCPAPPTDEVTAANVGSRSNTFAAAEGAPTHPAPSLWPLLPEPEPKAATGSLAACSLPGDARVSRTHPTLPLPTHGLPPFVPWPCSLWRCLLCRHQGVLGRDPAQRRDAGARGGRPAE